VRTIEPKLLKFLEDAPLFFQPWWLEMVAADRWDYAVATRGDEIAAVLPYTSKIRMGWRIIEMPPMTPYLGPWLRNSTAKYANRLAEEKDLMTELIKALPPFAFFHQQFHVRNTNWLPFYWKQFQQTTHYTYRIANTQDLDQLWNETRDNVRTDVKKAKKQVAVEESEDFEHVIRMQKLTLSRQNVPLIHSDEFLRAFGASCSAHKASKVLLARDGEGRTHACVYLLSDKQTVYYYTGGGDPELRNSGAASLLVWKAIEFASAQGKAFDFEGSMNESIERFFRSFGAVQTPYFQVTKTNSHIALAAKKILGWWKAS
jgi:lipid II:glycine glycyltransferase (peptidoglycan interpeptide bridge formation enzyme)